MDTSWAVSGYGQVSTWQLRSLPTVAGVSVPPAPTARVGWLRHATYGVLGALLLPDADAPDQLPTHCWVQFAGVLAPTRLIATDNDPRSLHATDSSTVLLQLTRLARLPYATTNPAAATGLTFHSPLPPLAIGQQRVGRFCAILGERWRDVVFDGTDTPATALRGGWMQVYGLVQEVNKRRWLRYLLRPAPSQVVQATEDCDE